MPLVQSAYRPQARPSTKIELPSEEVLVASSLPVSMQPAEDPPVTNFATLAVEQNDSSLKGTVCKQYV